MQRPVLPKKKEIEHFLFVNPIKIYDIIYYNNEDECMAKIMYWDE